MSKNFKGYMGDQIGKLGTAVGRRWKRKMVYSSYQGKVHNPRTEEQVSVRLRFGALSKLASAFLSAIDKGFKKMSELRQTTTGNCFISRNYSAVTLDEGGMVDVHFSNLTVSDGSLPAVTFGTADFSEPETVSVHFQGNGDQPNTDPNDKVYLFAYQPDLNQGMLSAAVQRSQATARITVPSTWQGMQVHLYGFAVGDGNKKRGVASESDYVGSGTIA